MQNMSDTEVGEIVDEVAGSYYMHHKTEYTKLIYRGIYIFKGTKQEVTKEFQRLLGKEIKERFFGSRNNSIPGPQPDYLNITRSIANK